MIRYTLSCGKGHGFESWFQNADAFEALAGSGQLACPVCGDTTVEKGLMAPAVTPARKAEAARIPAAGDKPGLTAPASELEQIGRAHV